MEAREPPFSARAVAALNRRTDAGVLSVKRVCELFGISTAAYFASRPRPLVVVEDSSPVRPPTKQAAPVEDVRDAIERVVKDHPAWGVRKVWASLRRVPYDLWVGHRRVYALMKDMNLCLVNNPPAPRVLRLGQVVVEQPNRRWATDLTTVWTKDDGLVAVAIVVDCGCRSVLEVNVTKAQDSPAVLAPLRSALVENFGGPEQVPHGFEVRTDHGSQYTGGDCEALCREWNIEHTLAPVGRPTGNAVAERTIRTMKEECIVTVRPPSS